MEEAKGRTWDYSIDSGRAVMAAGKKESDRHAAPLTAATSWVTLIDKGQYDKSWMTAAQYFKNAVTKKKWNEALKAFRKPFGKTKVRKEKSRARRKSLPGAPDGEYVVLRFDTAFEKKEHAVETVTIVYEKDGAWHVCGYFIR